jgi:hypothetical protein
VGDDLKLDARGPPGAILDAATLASNPSTLDWLFRLVPAAPPPSATSMGR